MVYHIKLEGNRKLNHFLPNGCPCLSWCADCVQNAEDYNAGGCRYSFAHVRGVGLVAIPIVLQQSKNGL